MGSPERYFLFDGRVRFNGAAFYYDDMQVYAFVIVDGMGFSTISNAALDRYGMVTLQTDFNYQDEVYFDALNNPLLSEDDYWTWNARASWRSLDERWEVAAFGRNLGDEEYMVYAFDLSFFGFNEEMIGTPRYYGMEASFSF